MALVLPLLLFHRDLPSGRGFLELLSALECQGFHHYLGLQRDLGLLVLHHHPVHPESNVLEQCIRVMY